MSDTTGKARGHGARLAEISNGIVTLHKNYYGKGPTEAKTYALDDTVVCVLRGGFTPVEETLMADGKHQEVENLRRSFQRTMRAKFEAVVEEALDRPVIGYMSQIHSDPDVAIEVFLLEPSEERLRGAHELRV